MTVPNRAGAHRGLLPATQAMYANMGNKQLQAVHASAKANPTSAKYSKRLDYTVPEMKSRGLLSNKDD